MKRTFKGILAFLFIFIIIALTVINIVVSKYGKGQIELHASKLIQGDVKIDNMLLQYYPASAILNDIKIQKYNEAGPLKEINIKTINASFDTRSLFSDLIIVKYLNVTEPEIVFDVGELGIKDFGEKAVKEVAASVEGHTLFGQIGLELGIIQKGVDVVRGGGEKAEKKRETEEKKRQYIDDAKKQSKFMINKLNITNGKFIPVGDVFWVKKDEQIQLPDIKMQGIDNASGVLVLERIQEVIGKALNDRVSSGKSNKKDESTK